MDARDGVRLGLVHAVASVGFVATATIAPAMRPISNPTMKSDLVIKTSPSHHLVSAGGDAAVGPQSSFSPFRWFSARCASFS
jgi:hypothetical protein